MAPSVAAPASVRHGAETAKPQQDSSPICPKTSPRKTAKKLFHVTFGTHKKQCFAHAKDLNSSRAKCSPTKCVRYLRNPYKTKTSLLAGTQAWQPPTPAGFQGVPWRSPCETLEQQQASSPCQAKCSPTKCSPLPLESIGIHKNKDASASPSETLDIVSNPSKTHAKKLFHVTFGTHKKQ